MDPTSRQFNGENESQSALRLDDGSGLRVVNARFVGEQQFDWDLFAGYDRLRVLTYSASAEAIVRMLDPILLQYFRVCVWVRRYTEGHQEHPGLPEGSGRGYPDCHHGLNDERHLHILEKIHAGQAHFRVLRKSVAHAKLYLLSRSDGRNRVIIGSANLSEQAFSGRQPETLVTFDDHEAGWNHYNRMFDAIRDSASDEIPLTEDRIINAEIEVSDTPVMSDISGTVVIEAPAAAESQLSAPVQVERIEKVAAILGPRVSAAIPAIRNGVQRITPRDQAGD